MLRIIELETRDMQFLQASIPKLKEFVGFIRNKNTSKLTKNYYLKIQEYLKEIIFFVIKETDNDDPFICEGIPIKVRQKLIREIRLIDIIVDTLYYPFSEEMFKLEHLSASHPICNVLRLAYRLIKHTVKNNKKNQFYTAQWIELFLLQSMQNSENNNLNAEKAITELLTNNKILLDK